MWMKCQTEGQNGVEREEVVDEKGARIGAGVVEGMDEDDDPSEEGSGSGL